MAQRTRASARRVMADQLYADCPNRVGIQTFGDTTVRHLCGCGNCPQPDPTPRELQARIDRSWVASNLHLAETNDEEGQAQP